MQRIPGRGSLERKSSCLFHKTQMACVSRALKVAGKLSREQILLDLHLIMGGDFLLAIMRRLDSFKQGHYITKFMFAKIRTDFLVEGLEGNCENKDAIEEGQQRG